VTDPENESKKAFNLTESPHQLSYHEAAMQPMSSTSSILDLPPEVTRQVWRWLLISPKPIKLYRYPETQFVLFENWVQDCVAQIRVFGDSLGISLDILHVCRRIYEEAVPFLYSENTFEYGTLRQEDAASLSFTEDFACLPLSKLRHFQTVRVSSACLRAHQLNPYANLKTVIFRYPHPLFFSCQIFRVRLTAAPYHNF
jgi:hypothetical protein